MPASINPVIDNLDFEVRGNDLRLELESVPGSDLGQGYFLGEIGCHCGCFPFGKKDNTLNLPKTEDRKQTAEIRLGF